MRVLVLGGSWFVGRVVAEDAVRRGHEVTAFNRGVLLGSALAGARLVRGDREQGRDVRARARQGPWDVVLDVAGSVPAVVRHSMDVLTDVAERCVFVSTISELGSRRVWAAQGGL
jgi:2'-hydroxyisoflavone reductase